MTGPTESLEERIERFGDALSRSDVDTAKRYVADDLTILSLSDGLKTYDRAWWEQMVPTFSLGGFELVHEHLVRRDEQAVHYRYARMTSTVAGAERTGMFCITDYWLSHPEKGWVVWQRLSVQVVDAQRLPDEF
ncbi:hypothetical protein P0L94_18190 [Microbacter sp. GSS18]|nr:hypothetical protein P0L94_18190 [Microbacter sp. GSS18]